MSHATILESNEAYEIILDALNEMPVSQKTITMRKEEQFFTVNYQGGGYWLYDNATPRGTSPLSDKEELIEELVGDLHALYHNNYTLEFNRQVYKLRNC